jgi:signal peptidase I
VPNEKSPTELDETPDMEHDDRGTGLHFLGWVWDTVKTWGPALLVVLFIRSVIAEPFRIPSGSMVPTLEIGDHILVTKYSYGLRYPMTRIPVTEISVPERGDVIVFVFPGSDEGKLSVYLDLPFPPIATLDYVKRVVGLPGEEIEVKGNVLHINGVAQARTFVEKYPFVDDKCRKNPTRLYDEDLKGVKHQILNTARYGMRLGDFKPTTVPEDHVFVMGDNRDHSQDSRVWGFVPIQNIKGRARFVWLSYDQCEKGMPMLGDVRGERFAQPIL